MALCKFIKAILAGEPINVSDYGKHRRNFAYIDDIVEDIVLAIDRIPAPDAAWSRVDHHIQD